MYRKLVVLEPLGLMDFAMEKIKSYATEVVCFDSVPKNNQEIIERIKDADALLISYTSTIDQEVLKVCSSLKYIGMCCSLYSPESANVDIVFANSLGISVSGVRDYGDQGVVEYVISELVGYLHGYGEKSWKPLPEELTDLKVGIVGLGVSGLMIARALKYLGANVSYYSRTRKSKAENEGIEFLVFNELLKHSDVIISCLNKNVILFDEAAFKQFGTGKIMFNTSIGPSHTLEGLKMWLDQGNNEFFCDSKGALGSLDLLSHNHVNCKDVSSGRTRQALIRLSEKVLINLEKSIEENAYKSV